MLSVVVLQFCLNLVSNKCVKNAQILADSKKAPAKKPVPKKAPAAEKKAAAGDDKSKDKSGAPAKHVRKALKVQKKVVKGTHGTRVKKVRTTVHFRRPKTYRPARDPKFPRKAIPKRNR